MRGSAPLFYYLAMAMMAIIIQTIFNTAGWYAFFLKDIYIRPAEPKMFSPWKEIECGARKPKLTKKKANNINIMPSQPMVSLIIFVIVFV